MRAALLDAAADILDTEGPDGLSIRRIAAAANVAPMGVYNHFESKNGIIEALFIQGFERLRDALAGIADIEDPYEALREAGRRYRALALAHPKVYGLMFLQAIPGYEPSQHALDVGTQSFQALVAAVQRAMATGVLAEGHPNETARIIWAGVHGWMSLELLGIGDVDDQEVWFDRLCTAQLEGLRTPSVPGAPPKEADSSGGVSNLATAGRVGRGSSARPPTGTSGARRPSGRGSSQSG